MDPETALAELARLRARVAELEAMEQRADHLAEDGGTPEERRIARYILGEA